MDIAQIEDVLRYPGVSKVARIEQIGHVERYSGLIGGQTIYFEIHTVDQTGSYPGRFQCKILSDSGKQLAVGNPCASVKYALSDAPWGTVKSKLGIEK